MDDLIFNLLKEIGENPSREGLQKTPKRWREMMKELTVGYSQSSGEIANGAIFPAESSEMVIIKNITFHSLCEHHMLPFSGKIHVGYLPDKSIIGLSKIPRIVEMYARRLQVQERLGSEVCSAINDLIHPKGIGVVVEAMHLCMTMRGAKKSGSNVRTHHFLGELRKGISLKEEFLQAIADYKD